MKPKTLNPSSATATIEPPALTKTYANFDSVQAINVGIVSLGCFKNLSDMEAVLAELENVQVAPIPDSDIIFLNTCGFLKAARDEVYESIEKYNDKKIIVIGCLASLMKEDLFGKYPQIAAIVNGTNYHNINNIFHRVIRGEKVYAVSPEPFSFEKLNGKSLLTPRSYAYVKIAEGCNHRCTYCIIPYLKGKFRSRAMEDILAEITDLVKLGIKEVILVSQDCGYYGTDLYGEKRLYELLQKINAIKGDFWIRVHYVYPEKIDEKLLEAMASCEKVCKYLDMPLQHGDKEVLRRMLRFSEPEKILEKVTAIRKMMPTMTFRTGFIVGFPGETEKNFNNLISFVKKIQFDHVGVFTFSREKLASSYNYPNQLTQKIKNERKEKLMLMQQKIALKKNKALIGTACKVLIEKYNPNATNALRLTGLHGDRKREPKTSEASNHRQGAYIGRSMRSSPGIDGEVIIKSMRQLKLYNFYHVYISAANEYDLFGELV
ncbi:30S ribosomal protein S12 methylthiotransferase RimO [Candidatus Peregrinibacteria bacterium]|nr:30S ribosomal protein S12 methylthiotransferase RimO [Candidatus Peregrinibacteria bacterium]